VGAQERIARPGFPDSKWIGANEPFEIVLEGEPAVEIAVILDKLDISALLKRPSPERLRYHGRGPALPSGAHTLTVYNVDAGGAWVQIGRFPIRLLTRRGFVSTKVAPAVDLTEKGQLGERHAPDKNEPLRTTFQDGTMQLGLRTELIRPSVTVRAEAQVAGMTYQNEALRFGSEGEKAPKVDLAGYRFDVQRGSTVLSLGHFGIGALRHLINGFQSRGVALTIGQGRAATMQLAVMNGSSIVGWSNALGFAREQHRVWSANLGVEAFPSTPGALRLEYGYFQGSSQPLTGFNDAGVVTAERSRGSAIHIASGRPGSRLRFDGGYTLSRFGHAFDAQVEDRLVVTPIRDQTRDAYYGDVSLDILRGRKLGSTTASATLNVRFEDIEPLFRSIGALLQPDLRTGAAEVTFNLNSVTGGAGHVRTRDNLGSIDSILTTRTERTGFTLALPLGSMLRRGAAESRWAPVVSLQAEALHQYGDGVPVSGGFTIRNIPDQASWNALLGADWQIGMCRAGVRFGKTEQDNRQVGSEIRDFMTDTGALTLDWTPGPAFGLGGDLGLDRNASAEQQKTSSTLRWAARMRWTFYKKVAVAASLTNIRAWDDRGVRDSENIDSSVELSAEFRLSRGERRKGRVFVRWIDRRADFVDRSFGLRDLRRSASFATGLTLRLFS
jgi:hypothetical protein